MPQPDHKRHLVCDLRKFEIGFVIQKLVSAWRTAIQRAGLWHDIDTGLPIVATRLELWKALRPSSYSRVSLDAEEIEALGRKRPPSTIKAHGATVSVLSRVVVANKAVVLDALKMMSGENWSACTRLIVPPDVVKLFAQAKKSALFEAANENAMRDRLRLVKSVLAQSGTRLADMAEKARLESPPKPVSVDHLESWAHKKAWRAPAKDNRSEIAFAFVVARQNGDDDPTCVVVEAFWANPRELIDLLGQAIAYDLKKCHAARSNFRSASVEEKNHRQTIILPRFWIERGVASAGDGDDLRAKLANVLKALRANERQSDAGNLPLAVLLVGATHDQPDWVSIAQKELKRVIKYKKEYREAMKMMKSRKYNDKTNYYSQVRCRCGWAFDAQDRYRNTWV